MYHSHAPPHPGRHHSRAPSARKVAYPSGGITCLPSALVQLRHHVLERSGACHVHRMILLAATMIKDALKATGRGYADKRPDPVADRVWLG